MGALGGFVNAGLLAGLALVSIPLIIHLLNRQRHKPLRWAAMRFVQAAWRKTRRRVQLENLLLLFLRMAAVALLALAVARPFTGAASPLAGLVESRRDLVLLVDGSASMGWREGVETSFEKALHRARALIRELDAGRGDRVRLVLCTGTPKLLSWTTPDQALSVLDTLSAPADEPLELASALGEVLQYAREDAGGAGSSTLEVRLLTDLQRRAFRAEEELGQAASAPRSGAERLAARDETPPAGAPASASGGRPALLEALDALAALSVRVLVEDFGASQAQPANLGIGALEPLGTLLGAGLPCDIAVEVLNHGASTKHGVRVILEIDGERRPVELVDVPARGRAQATFQVVFERPGEHVLGARLEGDRLPVDDQRQHVLPVPPPIAVLLVNGSPGATLEEDEIGLARAVLEPLADDAAPGREPTAFEVRDASPDLLATPEFKNLGYDVIWLADVESLPAAAVEPLERAVAQGAGLIVSLGPTVNPAAWNTRLFARDGSGLMPAELGEHTAVRSRREEYYRVGSFQAEHPVLSFFADERWKALLTEVPVYEFIATRPLPDAQVLASFDDLAHAPALVERSYDRGRVLLWTTTISPRWSRLAESPRTLVPLVHELVRHAARREFAPRNVAPGEPLTAEVTQFPRSLELARPDGTRRPLDGAAQDLGEGRRWRLPAVPGKETERAGLYRILAEGAAPLSFAVQLDAREGDLDRLDPRELSALHRALVPLEQAQAGGSAAEQRPERGELWRGLAWAALALLMFETLWAAFLGRRREVRR